MWHHAVEQAPMFRTILQPLLQVPKLTPALMKNVARRGQFTLKTEAAGPSETLALCTRKHGVTLMLTAVVHSNLTWVRSLRCGSHFKALVWSMCVATAACSVIFFACGCLQQGCSCLYFQCTVLPLIFLDCHSCVLAVRLSCFGHRQSETRVSHVYLWHYYHYFGKFIFRCEKPPKMICMPCITIKFHPMNLALFRVQTNSYSLNAWYKAAQEWVEVQGYSKWLSGF